MNKEQWLKILKVAMVATLIMACSDMFFSVPVINDYFSNLIKTSTSWIVYLIIWVLMFLQTNLLQIPALTILSASVSVGIDTLSPLYILIVLSAYITGCILTYWLGYKFGTKATKWIAGDEQEFNKWCNIINKKGKWWYFATIVLPIFPDDLLCLVAGSVKMNFAFYTIANSIGRAVGLITMLLTLRFIGYGQTHTLAAAIMWCVIVLIEVLAYLIIDKEGKKQ